jgi:hypothetical protein
MKTIIISDDFLEMLCTILCLLKLWEQKIVEKLPIYVAS